MICEDCGKEGAFVRDNRTGSKYRCAECELKEEARLGIQRNTDFKECNYEVKAFKPYYLEHGPRDLIPDTDPNKIKDKDGVGDLDKIYIDSKGSEKKYFEIMGIRYAEKGEKSQGHEIAMKKKIHREYCFLKG